jgi:hypothetical protein
MQLVLFERVAKRLLYAGIAGRLCLEGVMPQPLASDVRLIVELFELRRQTFVDALEHFFAFGREFGNELGVGIAEAILVAPVEYPVFGPTGKALLEALEKLTA